MVNLVVVVFTCKGEVSAWASPFCSFTNHDTKGNKKGGIELTDVEFQAILNKLNQYLETEKNFINNPFRETEIKKAIDMATQLFPDAKIELKSDPIQMGAMILRIENFDINVTGETEIKLFSDIINLADNFEIYALENGNIRFAAVFQNVLIRT